jgi:hypothetical protein
MEPEGSLPFTRKFHGSLFWAISSLYHPNLSKTHLIICSSHLHLGLPSGLFWLSHQYTICIPRLPIHITCRSLFILLDSIVLIVLGEKYKLWSSSLCNPLQLPVTSSLFGPNILFSTLSSKTLSLCSSHMLKTKFHTDTEPRARLYFCIF